MSDFLRSRTIDSGLLLLAYTTALAARLPFLLVEPHTPEGAHYQIANTLATKDTFVFYLYNTVPVTVDVIFWGRPLFFLILAPAAAVNFETMRIVHAVISALIAPASYLVLRSLAARRSLSFAAGAAVTCIPFFAVWETLLLPDALATLFFLVALVLYLRNHPVGAGIFAVAAMWTKEVSVVAVALLMILSFDQERRAGQASVWPFRLGTRSTALLGSIVVGLLPLFGSIALDARFPGWGRGGEGLAVLDRLVLIGWFWLLLALGLRTHRTRPVAFIALGQALFYVVYRFVLGRAIEIWYHVLPATLVLLAVFLYVDEIISLGTVARRTWVRRVAYAPAAVVIVVLLVFAGVSNSAPFKGHLQPFSRHAENSFAETAEYEAGRGRELRAAFELIGAVETLFTIDIDWSDEFYPAGEYASRVFSARASWVDPENLSIEPWARAIEITADATLIQRTGHSLNEAVLQTYADCIRFDGGRYAVLEGRECSGRYDALVTRWTELRAAER